MKADERGIIRSVENARSRRKHPINPGWRVARRAGASCNFGALGDEMAILTYLLLLSGPKPAPLTTMFRAASLRCFTHARRTYSVKSLHSPTGWEVIHRHPPGPHRPGRVRGVVCDGVSV